MTVREKLDLIEQCAKDLQNELADVEEINLGVNLWGIRDCVMQIKFILERADGRSKANESQGGTQG